MVHRESREGSVLVEEVGTHLAYTIENSPEWVERKNSQRTISLYDQLSFLFAKPLITPHSILSES